MPHAVRPADRTESASPAVSRSRLLALDRSTIAAFLLGAATVAGFAPLYLFPLPVCTLAVLLWLCRGADTPKRAATIGWWFGLGLFLTGVSWVYVSLNTFGAMPAPPRG
jgi:apolipoprotein N-acyltransferase